MQQGDVFETFAKTENLRNWIEYEPNTNLEEGLDKFVEWYKNIMFLKVNKLMKNILITGGTGFIGSHTCLALLEKDIIY